MVELWPNSCWKLDSSPNPHEANLLKLDISKSESQLRWHPTWSLETSLKKIVQWQKSYESGANMHDICSKEISQFIKDSKNNGHN
jgi:CDP-glucose 4,6-dehydratase